MQSKNIIKLLKLQEKNVILDNLSINSKKNIANIYVHKRITSCSCPSCKTMTSNIHDYRNQRIKHVSYGGYETFLILKKARLICPNCGKKFYYNYNDIVNPKFRCSNELFNKIIDELKNTSMTVKEIAKANFVSPGVVNRYLNFFSYLMQWNNIDTLPKRIGVDEFKGNCNKSKYLFHIYDLDTSNTIKILETRKFEDIINFLNKISNRNDVELVTMDLYSPFKNATQAKLKKAIIVADRFHYTRIVGNALDELRINIWRNCKGKEKKYFKNLKKCLLADIENVPEKRIEKLQEKLNYAFELSPELKYAYELYQSFLRIKDGSDYEEKAKRLSDWLNDALSSTLKTFESAANTLLKWNKEILNSLKTTYTNSSTEGKNNKIKVIKRIAYGYRNLTNFSNRIKLRDCKI